MSYFFAILAGIISSGASPAFDTKAWQTLLATNSGTVTAPELAAINRWRSDIGTSIWNLLYFVDFALIGNDAGSRTPYKHTWGSSLLAKSGTVAKSARGWEFTGTPNYMKTGMTPSSIGAFDSMNSSLLVWTSGMDSAVASAGIYGVWTNSGVRRTGMRWQTTGNLTNFNGSNSETSKAYAVGVNGVFAGSIGYRVAAGVMECYWNGTSKGTATYTSNTIPSGEEYIGQINGGGGEYFVGAVAAVIRGGALTAAQYLKLEAATARLIASLGQIKQMAALGDSLVAVGSGVDPIVFADTSTLWFQWGTKNTAVGGTKVGTPTDTDTGNPSTNTIWANLNVELAALPNETNMVRVVSAGRNDNRYTAIGDVPALVGNITALLNRSSAQGQYLWMECPPDTRTEGATPQDEDTGSAFAAVRNAINDQVTAIIGQRVVQTVEMDRASATISDINDIYDLDRGVIPKSMHSANDTVHPSAAAKAIHALAVWHKFVAGVIATNLAPANFIQPLAWIGGKADATAAVGDTVKVADGGWDGNPTMTYQWNNDATPIGGATSKTYLLVSGDSGHAITCSVIGTNAYGGPTTAVSTSITVS